MDLPAGLIARAFALALHCGLPRAPSAGKASRRPFSPEMEDNRLPSEPRGDEPLILPLFADGQTEPCGDEPFMLPLFADGPALPRSTLAYVEGLLIKAHVVLDVQPETMVIAVALIWRLLRASDPGDRQLPLTLVTARMLVATGLTIAAKSHEDEAISLAAVCAVLLDNHVSVPTFARWELHFLSRLDFRTNVDPPAYARYARALLELSVLSIRARACAARMPHPRLTRPSARPGPAPSGGLYSSPVLSTSTSASLLCKGGAKLESGDSEHVGDSMDWISQPWKRARYEA
jgi:hypothetical protein